MTQQRAVVAAAAANNPTCIMSPILQVRLLVGVWVVIWFAVVCVLVIYWHTLPMWVSWPLAILEAIFVPDLRTLRRVFFRNEGE